MPNETKINSPTENDWALFDDMLKRYALMGFVALSIGIAVLVGPHALYPIIGLAALAGFALYPEINPEWVLFGAIMGAINAGPLGLLAGAAAGYYLTQRYEQFIQSPMVQVIHSVKSTPTRLKSLWDSTIACFAANENAAQEHAAEAPQPTITSEPNIVTTRRSKQHAILIPSADPAASVLEKRPSSIIYAAQRLQSGLLLSQYYRTKDSAIPRCATSW